jgi:hypothetical protein
MMPCGHNVCSKCLDNIIPKYSKDTLENSQRCPMCRIHLVRFLFQKKVCYDEPKMILGNYNKETGDYQCITYKKVMPKLNMISIFFVDLIKALSIYSDMYIYLDKVEYYDGLYVYEGYFIITNPEHFYHSPNWEYRSRNRYTNSKELINGIGVIDSRIN